MRAKEFVNESLELKPGNIIDLGRNYPQYSKLLARVESISSSGTKYQLLIVKADSPAKNPPYRTGQTIKVAANYIRRCPIVAEAKQRLDPKCWKGYKKQGTKVKGGVRVNNCVPEEDISEAEPGSLSEDWQKVNRKDKTDGMSSKAVKAYRRENPGSNLKTAVTKKPSEIKKGSSDDKRRKSFCARMSGVEGPMKKPNGEPTNKAKALKRWNC